MRKLSFFLFTGGLLFSFFIAHSAAESNITFPVAELGNCADKAECRAWCDQKEHHEQCVEFASKHKLISQVQADRARRALTVQREGGPGGCAGIEECKQYCNNKDHRAQCIVFAKAKGLLNDDQAKRIEDIEQTLKERKDLPGGCTSKEACEAYCHEEAHFDECIEFAKRSGLVSDREYEVVKKTRGKGPGGCSGRECQTYCQEETHIDECVNFAKEHGLISEKEAEVAQKIRATGPGGCKGEECKEYCAVPEHKEECMRFGKEHGFVTEKPIEEQGEQEEEEVNEHEAEPQKRSLPQRCDGPACKEYCSKPEHKEECARLFAPKDQVPSLTPRIESENESPVQTTIPPAVLECLEQVVGPEAAQRIQRGDLQPTKEIQVKINACFDRVQQLKERHETQRPVNEEEHSPSPQEFLKQERPTSTQVLGRFGAVLIDVLFLLLR